MPHNGRSDPPRKARLRAAMQLFNLPLPDETPVPEEPVRPSIGEQVGSVFRSIRDDPGAAAKAALVDPFVDLGKSLVGLTPSEADNPLVRGRAIALGHDPRQPLAPTQTEEEFEGAAGRTAANLAGLAAGVAVRPLLAGTSLAARGVAPALARGAVEGVAGGAVQGAASPVGEGQTRAGNIAIGTLLGSALGPVAEGALGRQGIGAAPNVARKARLVAAVQAIEQSTNPLTRIDDAIAAARAAGATDEPLQAGQMFPRRRPSREPDPFRATVSHAVAPEIAEDVAARIRETASKFPGIEHMDPGTRRAILENAASEAVVEGGPRALAEVEPGPVKRITPEPPARPPTRVTDAPPGARRLRGGEVSPGQVEPPGPAGEAGFVNLGPVGRWMRENLTVEGLLPKEAFHRNVRRRGRIRAQLRRADDLVTDLERAGWKKMSPTDRDAVLSYLHGDGQLGDVPVKAQSVAKKMREMVDVMSAEIATTPGLVSAETRATIGANLGRYLTRTYEAFRTKNWGKTIKQKRPEVVENARQYLARENPTLPPERVEGLVNELLNVEGGPLDVLQRRTLGSKNLSVLMERGDIAPEIQALWGVDKDVRVNFAQSITKMAHLLENHRFLTDVLAEGEGKYFFRKPVGEFAAPVATTETMNPLSGYYTTPEIAAAFRPSGAERAGWWLRGYYALNGMAKYGKTVLSPVTHIRNFLSNGAFAMANGHFQVGPSALKAVRSTIADLARRGGDEMRAFNNRMVELGIVDENVQLSELQELLRDAAGRIGEDMLSEVVVRRAWVPIRLASRLYQAEDAFWKVNGFLVERQRYAKARPDLSPQALDDMVAGIIRDTYPTYSMIPLAFREFRRFPLLGPFISFAVESVRVAKNTIRQTVREISDPRTRAIGVTRAGGTMVAAATVPAIVAATKAIFGVSDQEERDIRRFLAPWSKNSALQFWSRNAAGQRTVSDLSYMDPYALIRRPLMTALRGDASWEEQLEQAALEALRPFTGEELVSSVIIDLMRNKTGKGREVYNPQDSRLTAIRKSAAHLARTLQPGVVTSVQRIVQASQGELPTTPGAEILATVTGQRQVAVNIPKTLGYKARAYDRDMQEARRIVTSLLPRQGTLAPGEVERAFAEATQAQERLTRELYLDVQAATRQGMSLRDVARQLIAAGLNEQEVRAVVSGRPIPLRPSRRAAEGVQLRGTVEPAEQNRRFQEMGNAARKERLRAAVRRFTTTAPPP